MSTTVTEGKLGYDQIQTEKVIGKSTSKRSGSDTRNGRTDIARTNTSTNSGTKDQMSSGENKSERKVDTQNATSRATVERHNLGFRLTFSIPITGIIPTNATGTNC